MVGARRPAGASGPGDAGRELRLGPQCGGGGGWFLVGLPRRWQQGAVAPAAQPSPRARWERRQHHLAPRVAIQQHGHHRGARAAEWPLPGVPFHVRGRGLEVAAGVVRVEHTGGRCLHHRQRLDARARRGPAGRAPRPRAGRLPSRASSRSCERRFGIIQHERLTRGTLAVTSLKTG